MVRRCILNKYLGQHFKNPSAPIYVMNSIKLSWVILFCAILCNLGAFVLTNIALANGGVEGNGTTAILYKISPLAVLGAMICVYILLIFNQRRLIKRAPILFKNHPNMAVLIIPCIALIMFGIDVTNNILVVFFNLHYLGWFQYIFIWNQFLM